MKARSFLPALQVCRAIAALMVVFHHYWHEVIHFFHVHNSILDYIADCGKSGVDFFFVLSGFIICYAHMEKRGDASAIKDYALGRVLRIYIPYLPIGLCMLAAYKVFPSLSYVNRDINTIKSVTLLPFPGLTALSVAWTLVHEMFFYMVFVVFFLSRRWFAGLIAAWVILICLGWWLHWGTDHDLPGFVLNPYNVEFILGVFGAYAFARILPFGVKGVALGLIALTTVLSFCPAILDSKLMVGSIFLLLVLLAAHSPLNRISARNILMILGNASYSIYLIHDPEISLFMRIVPKHSQPVYLWGVSLSFIIAVCVSGVLYSRIFERYLLKKAKAWIMQGPAPAPRGSMPQIAS
jgi:peptidoglycan/LPS O-acetylase OafA/YrhL